MPLVETSILLLESASPVIAVAPVSTINVLALTPSDITQSSPSAGTAPKVKVPVALVAFDGTV